MIKQADDPKQLRITHFFKYISKINDFIETNEHFKDSFSKSSLVEHIKCFFPNIELTTFLKNILTNLEKNSKKNKHGNRFDDEFKQFCAHTYLVSGLLSYEILAKNVGNLPSPVTLNRLISKESCVREGELNLNGLLEYFNQKKYPKIGWLSEDQTRIVSRLRYNSKYNTIDGLVSPLVNGIPVLNFNLAETATDIKKLLIKYPVSTTINVVMIQPIVDGSAAFCLLAYGSDNRFTAEDCLKRWNFIKTKLKENDFQILGESADGDPKVLKAMKLKSGLSTKPYIFDWFHVSKILHFLY